MIKTNRVSCWQKGGEKVLSTYQNGGDWKEVAVDESAKITGNYIGGVLGAGAVGFFVPETSGLSLVATPAVVVGTRTIRGYAFEKSADQTYKYLFK